MAGMYACFLFFIRYLTLLHAAGCQMVHLSLPWRPLAAESMRASCNDAFSALPDPALRWARFHSFCRELIGLGGPVLRLGRASTSGTLRWGASRAAALRPGGG